MTKTKRITPDYIFESSWEVCNKVGGIYTVLSTRAKTLQTLFPDKIIFFGPDLWKETDNADFIESKTLLKGWKKYAKEKDNLNMRIGRWNIPGKPIAVLVDFQSYYEFKDTLYYEMWEKFEVDSISAYGDYDEACMFAYSAGLAIESFYFYSQLSGKNIIAHVHEWMLGMTALYLQDRIPDIATIFTTHATSIGRSICGNNKPLYSQLTNYNGDQMARELNMEAKHSLEKQTAWHVDCFTTVSELTAIECRQLLEKSPDIVTPNGFEFHFVPLGEEAEAKRKIARKTLIRVASKLTGGQIPDDALLVAISGRYEYKNKGIDLFIEAINRVCEENPIKPVIAFIMVPADFDNPQIYQNTYFTKLLFIPYYLNGNDGIFNLSYYDLLIGLDLTIFPSYYEPWGYTPLESIAFGVPTITTNLAGFGLWAREEGAGGNDWKQGIRIVERTDTNYFDVAEEIKEIVIDFSKLSPDKILPIRKAAQTLSLKADWSHFIEYYLEAYTIAFENKDKRINKKI